VPDRLAYKAIRSLFQASAALVKAIFLDFPSAKFQAGFPARRG
jgi:hypothetical protein